MIHFRGKPITSTTTGRKAFKLIFAEKLAEQLNSQGIELDCPVHKDSLAIVDIATQPLKFHVATCCCPQFGAEIRKMLKQSWSDLN